MSHIPPQPLVPDGYMVNSFGHLVPEHMVRPEIKLADQVARLIEAKALELQRIIGQYKAEWYADILAHQQLLDERYGVKVRAGTRGGTTIESYDGSIRVSISVADSITLGPELSQAKALVDECLMKWSEGANANLRALIDDAFAVGDGGKMAVDRILGLRRLDIADETWKRAMEAINDAIKVARSKSYLRIYRRPAPDKDHEQVVLDFAKL